MSTHPNHRRGHGRIRGARGKPYRCRGCDRCMMPEKLRAYFDDPETWRRAIERMQGVDPFDGFMERAEASLLRVMNGLPPGATR